MGAMVAEIAKIEVSYPQLPSRCNHDALRRKRLNGKKGVLKAIMTNTEKLIDYRLFNPLQSLFKQGKNEKALLQTVYCSNSENCEAYKEGRCVVFAGLFNTKCPYGRLAKEEGYTRRARQFYEWISEKEKKVKDVKQLEVQPLKMCMVGEYVYFPYPHWDLDKKFEEMDTGKFLKNDVFTVEFIQTVITARPRSLMGGEIKSFQNEVVPLIVQHLEEVFPTLFKEWALQNPEFAKIYEKKSYVGRKAYVKTLPVGCRIPHRNGEMVWDGEKLTISDYAKTLLPISSSQIENAKLIITPTDNAAIEITSDDQVCDTTRFKD